MASIKCKICGGTIEFEPGATVGVCDSCGMTQELTGTEVFVTDKIPSKNKMPHTGSPAKKKKAAILIAVLIIAAIVIAVLTVKSPSSNGEYQEACALMEAGDYEVAISAFSELGDYKDSAAKLAELQAALDAAEKMAEQAAAEAEIPIEDETEVAPTDDSLPEEPAAEEQADTIIDTQWNQAWLTDYIAVTPDSYYAGTMVDSWKAHSYQGEFVIGGTSYAKGLGIYTNRNGAFDWSLSLPSGAKALSFEYGPDGVWQYGSQSLYGTVQLKIYSTDGEELFSSGDIYGTDGVIFEPIAAEVDLKGNSEIILRLVTTLGSDGSINLVIGNAKVYFTGDATATKNNLAVDELFERLSNQGLAYTSGVGAWYEMIEPNADGSFYESFFDSNMGDIGDDYPYGTIYSSDFNGVFTNVKKISDYEYSMQVSNQTRGTTEVGEWIVNGVRNVCFEPTYHTDGGEVRVYLAGYKTANLPEACYNSSPDLVWGDPTDTLQCDCIYFVSEGKGYFTSSQKRKKRLRLFR